MGTLCLLSNVVHGAMIIIEIIGYWELSIQRFGDIVSPLNYRTWIIY